MYEVTGPVFAKMILAVRHVLDKAEADAEASFADLHARLEKALDYANSFTREQLDGRDGLRPGAG